MTIRSIQATTEIPVAFERALSVVTESPGLVFTGRPRASWSEVTLAELHVDVPGGTSLRQEVMVHLPQVSGTADRAVGRLSWEPAGHGTLIPDFEGTLELVDCDAGTEITVAGTYHPPAGVFGAVGDGLVGHRIARQSLTNLVVEMGERVRVEAHQRAERHGPGPTPCAPDLRATPHRPESWIG